MAKLMAAIDKDTKIILMGDQNQLPSVELGAVLADICTLFKGDVNRFSAEFIALSKTFLSDDYLDACVEITPTLIQDACVQLQRSYRFSSYKGLGLFASQLLNNETIDLRELSQVVEGEGVQSVATWGDKQIEQTLKGFEAYLKEKDPQKALTYFNHVRVLSSTYEGSLGVNQLNLKVEQYLSDHFGLNTKDRNYINRPVMVTQNDYNLGLYNGDIGIIKLDEQGEKKVFFEDGKNGLKSFDPAFLSKVETVFAMTIHKSQGSEFKEVILVLPNNTTSEILCKELIYTAITRAKEKVVLVGTQEVFDKARTRTQNRMSNLNHLLR
jgi:exodeoxyribonuclease V alpha subunit